MGGLAAPDAPRVLTAATLRQVARQYRAGASESTIRSAADMLVSAGALRQVSSGLFLNQRATPPAELIEAAPYIRSGAIISLHSVLGSSGFLNNPSALAVAVLPTSASKRPRLGDATTSSGDLFRFYGLAERFFPATQAERWDTLQQGRPVDMFRPEAALLQWLHLASMKRSSLTLPPVDVDMEVLDEDLLVKLADRWALTPHLVEWLALVNAGGMGQEGSAEHAARVPSRVALEASRSAKSRLMARRGSSR